MQLGMIGLGRMGSNMVRRLLARGHECVVHDSHAEAATALGKEGAIAATSLDDFLARLKPPRAVWMMVPAAAVELDDRAARREAREGRHPDRRRQLVLSRRHPPRRGAEVPRDSLCRRRHQRGRLGARAGLLHDDRRRDRDRPGSRPDLRRPGAGIDSAPRTPEREKHAGTSEEGYLHCGPNGAGHFVKMVHNGIEYGIMAAYAEGFNILKHAGVGKASQDVDAETAPLRHPEQFQYDLNVADIAEVWRRGSVIASWLLDLTAQRSAAAPTWPISRGGSRTRARAAGRSRRRSRPACRRPSSAPPCSPGSARAGRMNTPTSCSRPCGTHSADTSRRRHDEPSGAERSDHDDQPRASRRRPGLFRSDRRPGLQEGFPRAPVPRPARAARRADRGSRQVELDRRTTSSSGPGTASPATGTSMNRHSPRWPTASATSTAITTTPRRS